MTEDEMVGWHHQFNGYELGQTLKDGEGTGRHAMLQSMGLQESDTTEQLNNMDLSGLRTSTKSLKKLSAPEVLF